VEIVALLSDHLLTAFSLAVGSRHSVRTVRTVAAFDTVLRLHPIDVAVIDPQAAGVGRGGLIQLIPVLARHSTVPTISYTRVSPEAVRACACLATHGVRHVVLKGYDDDPASFRALLEGVGAEALSDAVLALLEPILAQLPGPVAGAIESLFQLPHTVGDVEALARLAGMPRRTFDRVLARVGLVQGWTLIRAARVVRAYDYLRGPASRVKEAAAKVGYVRPEQLTEDVTLITGFLPSSLPGALEPEDFVARVARRLRRVPVVLADDPPVLHQTVRPAVRDVPVAPTIRNLHPRTGS
jgi:AraC-like DNA-binding protein